MAIIVLLVSLSRALKIAPHCFEWILPQARINVLSPKLFINLPFGVGRARSLQRRGLPPNIHRADHRDTQQNPRIAGKSRTRLLFVSHHFLPDRCRLAPKQHQVERRGMVNIRSEARIAVDQFCDVGLRSDRLDRPRNSPSNSAVRCNASCLRWRGLRSPRITWRQPPGYLRPSARPVNGLVGDN